MTYLWTASNKYLYLLIIFKIIVNYQMNVGYRLKLDCLSHINKSCSKITNLLFLTLVFIYTFFNCVACFFFFFLAFTFYWILCWTNVIHLLAWPTESQTQKRVYTNKRRKSSTKYVLKRMFNIFFFAKFIIEFY